MPWERANAYPPRAPSAPATASSAANGQPPVHARTSTAGMAMAAKAMRRVRLLVTRPRPDACQTSLAALVVQYRPAEGLSRGGGSPPRADVQLRVCRAAPPAISGSWLSPAAG